MVLSDTLQQIQLGVIRYVDSIYLIFGIPGCCLNIFLLSRRKFRTASCCIYFLTASVTMLINLALGIGSTMYSLNHIDAVTTILIFCKIRIYVLQSTAMIYRWAFVVASFDRYVTSSTNLYLRNFAKISVARRAVVVIVCIWLILPIHAPILYHLRVGGCGIFNTMAGALYHSIFTTVFGCILPVSLMTVFAILIYRNLLRQRRLQHYPIQISTQANKVQRWTRRRDHQVLAMLLIQILIYILSIIPLTIMNLYNASTINVPDKSADRLTIEKFVFNMVEVAVYIFSVLSFYLYTMASKMFYGELKNLLRSLVSCKWTRTRRIAPVVNKMPLKTTTRC